MVGLPAVVLNPEIEPSVLMVKRTVRRRMCWLKGVDITEKHSGRRSRKAVRYGLVLW